MQTIIGTLLDVTSRERTWPSGDKSIEHTAHILDGIATVMVTLQGPSRDGRNPGLAPEVLKPHNGERVCLSTYSRGHKNGNVYVTAVALLTADDLADALGLVSV